MFDKKKLILEAMEAQKKSYAPYSHYNVGAAVLMTSGRIYQGANIENASYPASKCAEHNAITRAVMDGVDKIVAVAVVGGKDFSARDYCAPCGICRQVMREFGNPKDVHVLMAKGPDDFKELLLEELLPESFGPEDLDT